MCWSYHLRLTSNITNFYTADEMKKTFRRAGIVHTLYQITLRTPSQSSSSQSGPHDEGLRFRAQDTLRILQSDTYQAPKLLPDKGCDPTSSSSATPSSTNPPNLQYATISDTTTQLVPDGPNRFLVLHHPAVEFKPPPV